MGIGALYISIHLNKLSKSREKEMIQKKKKKTIKKGKKTIIITGKKVTNRWKGRPINPAF